MHTRLAPFYIHLLYFYCVWSTAQTWFAGVFLTLATSWLALKTDHEPI